MASRRRSESARSSRRPRPAGCSRLRPTWRNRQPSMAKRNLAELKIPATSAFIPVAKRVATTLGGQLGLSLMALDELSIALTQACDSAISAAEELGTPADLKLTYFATNRALVVDVDLMPIGTALPMPGVKHESHVDPQLQRLAS